MYQLVINTKQVIDNKVILTKAVGKRKTNLD